MTEGIKHDWSIAAKIKVLKQARADLIKFAYWGTTHASLDCLDQIIEEYERKVNETH